MVGLKGGPEEQAGGGAEGRGLCGGLGLDMPRPRAARTLNQLVWALCWGGEDVWPPPRTVKPQQAQKGSEDLGISSCAPLNSSLRVCSESATASSLRLLWGDNSYLVHPLSH